MSSLQCATTLVIARHGEAEYESSEWEEEGGSLTALGRRQAADLAEEIAGRRVAHVWTSTLARAVQTGEIVAARLGVGVTTRLGLCEIEAGDSARSAAWRRPRAVSDPPSSSHSEISYSASPCRATIRVVGH